MELLYEYIKENPNEFKELMEIQRNSDRIENELEERRKAKRKLIEQCKQKLKER